MKKEALILCFAFSFLVSARAQTPPATDAPASTPVPIQNPGFEDGMTGWDSTGDNSMGSATGEAAHAGKLGLCINDADPTKGSSVASQKISVQPGEVYEVHFWAKNISGNGTKVYLQFLDAADAKVTDITDPASPSQHINVISLTVPSETADWKAFSLQGTAPDGAAKMYIWIHSGVKAQAVTYFDDFTLTKIK